jgi:Ca2+-binding RTX toxin-like protein
MNGARSVTATFVRDVRRLTVTRTGPGRVTSSPAGIDCGSDCTEDYPIDTTVVLTATPDAGAVFVGWGGACSGTSQTCTVTMNVKRSVTATFASLHQLTVAKAGTGGGTVSSTPSGIDCGATCTASYAAGTTVALTAAPDASSVFVGWSGGCTGTKLTCNVTMSSAKTVTATFTRIVVSIADASGNEGNPGSPGLLSFSVTVSPAPGHAVTVPFTLQPGSAGAGTDYGNPTLSPITISANGAAEVIKVPLVADLVKEPNETFTVALQAPTGAALGDGTATGTIVNDDVCTQVGGPGADELTGTSGADYLCGLGGNDTLIGLDGDDVLHGGAGVDTVSYEDAASRVTGSLSTSITGSSTGSDDIIAVENFIGTSGVDVVSGTDANNVLSGRGGGDVLRGGDGEDSVAGGGGDDTLYGGANNDLLNGNAGIDLLFGEAGNNDELHGGPEGGNTLDGGPGKQDICSAAPPPGDTRINCERFS